jgi:hypothetical protein
MCFSIFLEISIMGRYTNNFHRLLLIDKSGERENYENK